jgi:predicted AlkP superfamily pyrophosphatase or phosphodiesterase
MTVRRVRTSLLAILIAAAVLAPGCRATPPSSEAVPAPVSPVPSPVSPSAETTLVPAAPSDEAADNPVDRVIAISIDGLNPRAIQQLGQSRTPTFHRLMREGAYTLNARTVREQTRTLPNHTAMLTGRRVDGEHGGHGYTENVDNGTTVHRAAGHYVASVFDVVHDNGRSTALFAAKTKFNVFKRTWNAHGGPDQVGPNDGRAKIDRFTIDLNNGRLVAKLTADLSRSRREFTFVHLSLPDRAGHAHNFMGREYLDAVEQTDRLLGRILETVAARPALRGHTLVLLTADHGGEGATHYAAGRLTSYRIPFMAWGPGVPAGRDLYSLNPSFRNPGASRTDYRGKQPIRNADLTNVVTAALDLPRVPGSELISTGTLNVFG